MSTPASPGRPTRHRQSTNPVLIGTAVLAVVIVGVFLSYNANKGLPYVPVYQLEVDVPDAARMVPGAEVRIGGARVGQVQTVDAIEGEGGRPPFARLDISVDKKLEGLPRDSKAAIRPRSILGSTFVELIPGRAEEEIPAGGRIPLDQVIATEQLDESFDLFDRDTREGLQDVTVELGNALAGRGPQLNEAILRLNQLMPPLDRVLDTLRDPTTDVEGFLQALNATMQALEPVAGELGTLLDNVSVVSGAVDRSGENLDAALEKLPGTSTAGVRGLQAIRPVTDEVADLAADIRPGTALLPQASRDLADALEDALPILPRLPRLAGNLRTVAVTLDRTARDPATAGAIRKLTATVQSLRPTLEFLNPAQTQCNLFGVFTRNAASAISEGDANGTWFGTIIIPIFEELTQASSQSHELHVNVLPNMNAAECEAGNEYYLPGKHVGNLPGDQRNSTIETTPTSIIPTGPPTP